MCTGGCVWRGPFWEALSGEDATQSHDPSLPAGQAWGHWAPGWPRTRFRASHSLSSGVQTSSRPQSPSVTWGVRGHGPRDPGLRPLKGEMKPVCPGGAAGPYAAPRSVSPAPAARTLSASQYGCREPRARGGGAGGRVGGSAYSRQYGSGSSLGAVTSPTSHPGQQLPPAGRTSFLPTPFPVSTQVGPALPNAGRAPLLPSQNCRAHTAEEGGDSGRMELRVPLPHHTLSPDLVGVLRQGPPSSLSLSPLAAELRAGTRWPRGQQGGHSLVGQDLPGGGQLWACSTLHGHTAPLTALRAFPRREL